MTRTLTALYDLLVSPPTFDFAYTVVQAEVQRRRLGYDRLTFHVRRGNDPGINIAYGQGEPDWRLRHIVAPLSQMLPAPANLEISTSAPSDACLFSRPYGLHWLSDVVLLAEAGEDVQVLAAQSSYRDAVAEKLRDFVRDRRLITVTLRETNYGISRNSDLRTWASLVRQLPRDEYAVVVLRDHERVSEPLTPEWGEVLSLPGAVWSVHRRAALYELAWFNFVVNTGPAALLVLNPRTRFVLFKMLGGTPETSRQHFRRLGIEPYHDLAFLRPHQHIVWDIDDISVLRDRIFGALAAFDADLRTSPRRPAQATACLITAARRDYRTGLPAADNLARLPPGPARAAVALEWAAMLLEEDRITEAAVALGEAPDGPQRAALAVSIAHARPEREVIRLLAPLMTGSPPGDWNAALRRAAEQPPPSVELATRTVWQPEPLILRLSGSAPPEAILTRLASAEWQRRRRGLHAMQVIFTQSNEATLSIAALFPAITSISLRNEEMADADRDGSDDALFIRGMATVPYRAATLLTGWLRAQPFALKEYAVIAPAVFSGVEVWADAERAARAQHLHPIAWKSLAEIWPIELLAALLLEAGACVLADPLAVTLAQVLDLPCLGPEAFAGVAT
jgi:hypothetical protein